MRFMNPLNAVLEVVARKNRVLTALAGPGHAVRDVIVFNDPLISEELAEERRVELIRVIDELRPVLQVSLHGIDVGGSFVSRFG